MSGLSVFFDVPQLLNQVIQIQGGSGSLSADQIDELIKGLPHINEKQLADLGEKENSCPICFTPYLSLIAEEEMAWAMESPAHPADTIGVTKLSQPWQCGHMFCKRDITKWILDGHDSCPLCRHVLVERNQGRQDNESSESRPPDNAIRSDMEELRAQLANVDLFGFYPGVPLQREGGADRGVEYESGIYS